MEKLQKYCLSIMLVIIYSNVSANIITEATNNIGCRTLSELCKKILSEDFDDSIVFSNLNTENKYFVLNQRHTANDILGKNLEIQSHYIGDYIFDYFELSIYDKALENFEKQSKQNDFAENIYFKSKVAKIRNKDDLDLKNRTWKHYDENL